MASNKEYHDFLQFLYFEGYTESYAEAEELLETLTDDEIEVLNEARRKLAHSFPLKPSERRSVENIRRALDGEEPSPRRTETRSARKEEPKRKRTTDLKKVIIAQYLFDEGYADTPESAEVMSESISETWMNQILESQEEE
jgi:Fe-S-cluster formation regulator IscX/YfhJ